MKKKRPGEKLRVCKRLGLPMPLQTNGLHNMPMKKPPMEMLQKMRVRLLSAICIETRKNFAKAGPPRFSNPPSANQKPS